MKILLASYNHRPYIGGIETYSNKLEDYLIKSNEECYFVNNYYSSNKIIRLVTVLVVTFVKLIFLKTEIVHITNINLWPIVLINLFKKNKINFIINLHGLEMVFGSRENIISKLYNFFVPLNLINKLPNLSFFCNSNETLKLAKNFFDDNKLTYIPMGVTECRHFITKKVDKNQFFFLGRIAKRKGVSWFTSQILPNFPDKKLLIAGPISDKIEFENILKSSQVEYLGTLSETEIIKLHQNSFLTIFPNLVDDLNIDFEGFGISFIESLANGGLPIASMHQGLNSASLSGQIGLCISDNQSANWIKAINTLEIKGLEYRKKLIAKGQNLIEDNFLWEKIFDTTMIEYKNIIE
jgi:phosphatidylinositol alpha-1,6-mannosyltransferase